MCSLLEPLTKYRAAESSGVALYNPHRGTRKEQLATPEYMEEKWEHSKIERTVDRRVRKIYPPRSREKCRSGRRNLAQCGNKERTLNKVGI